MIFFETARLKNIFWVILPFVSVLPLNIKE